MEVVIGVYERIPEPREPYIKNGFQISQLRVNSVQLDTELNLDDSQPAAIDASPVDIKTR